MNETKVEMSDHNAQRHIWWEPRTAYQHKHLIPTVKCIGEEVMIWACFAATGIWPQTQQQINSRMSEKEKNQDVAEVQSKSRRQTDWNAAVGPGESCLQTSRTRSNVVKNRERILTGIAEWLNADSLTQVDIL